MQRKKLLYWGIQFSGWTTYFLLSILLLTSTQDLVLTSRLFFFVSLSIFSTVFISHGIRFTIIRQSVIEKPIYQIILITLLLSIAAAFILEVLQYTYESFITIDYAEVLPEDTAFNWASFLFAVSRSIILFLLWCGFYFAFIIAEKSRAQEILNLKWEASKNEIELKNLRAQLNPHFLFNSLNSIRALVELNPTQAKTSITQLSNLLRQSINLGKMRLIPLSDELNLVKTYLNLEQVRFEERLATRFDIQPEALNCEIPPLLIQTIVENAIKHGIAQSVEGGIIEMVIRVEQDFLNIIVRNTGELKTKKGEAGIGIKNSKKRLDILYGKGANFSIQQEGEQVVVNIKIKYQ